MLFIAGNDAIYCPYRDCLGIDTTSGRVSWYQLLAVSADASREELLHRWNKRRTLVARKRSESGETFWDNVLDELDRALGCLSNPRVKADYDENLSRRGRQTSLIRRQQVNEKDASEFRESTRIPGSGRKSKDPQEALARTRFEPLRIIGRGQHGTKVVEAYEFVLGRTVAVKSLEKQARTQSRRRSFLDEARFLASVSHPNLVEVHSVNENNCCFVMEFLGKSMPDQFLSGKKTGGTPEQVTRFLEQALSVLQFLHERGVVHGAISTKSFLVTETGVVKLIDAPGCTRAGLFRAPAPYQKCVAPELLSPESFGEPKATVDLYMLGHVAIELLAGDRLSKWFRKVSTENEPDQKQWLRWHASPFEKVPSLEQLVPDIPVALASVIEKLCEKQVADRYRTAEAALKDLIPADTINLHGVRSTCNSISGIVGSSPGAEPVAGDAPLLREAKVDSELSPDLLTILQDPELLWKAFRISRKLQVVTGFTLSLVMIVMLVPIREPVKIVGNKTQPGPVPRPVILPPEKPHNTKVAESSPPATQNLNPPNNMISSAKPMYQDLEQTSPRIIRHPTNKNAASNRAVTLAMYTPVVRLFAADMKSPDQFSRLKRILTELTSARGRDERRRLLDEARKIAPKDPRAPFIFAATYEFGSRAADELRESVSLSSPEFTQPFRKSIEAILRGPMRDARTGDRVLAELIRFRDQLDSHGFSSADAYDWEWIGRVIGYLERIARNDESLRMILNNNKPRIVSRLQSNAEEYIERGRRFVFEYDVTEFTAETFFPASAMIEINLCLATLTNQRQNAPETSSGTAVAANVNE
jgi:serine/threonine protein kinase